MAEPERPQPVTPDETQEPAVHPDLPTDQPGAADRAVDRRDTAVHPDLGADRRDTAVHPDLGADGRDTAVLPDGGSAWTPPAAGGTGTGSHAGTAVGTGYVAGPGAGGTPGARGRRSPDLLALTAAAVFCLVAVLGLVGTSLPGWMFGGGFVAVVLVVAGAGLLVNELRRSRT